MSVNETDALDDWQRLIVKGFKKIIQLLTQIRDNTASGV